MTYYSYERLFIYMNVSDGARTITGDAIEISVIPSPLLIDSSGNFTTIFGVLTQESPGVHTVFARDEQGDKTTAYFIVIDLRDRRATPDTRTRRTRARKPKILDSMPAEELGSSGL
jgi:hypothetical protein